MAELMSYDCIIARCHIKSYIMYFYIIRYSSATIVGTLYWPNKCWTVVGRDMVNDVALPKFGFLVDVLAHSSHGPLVTIFVFKTATTKCYNARYAAFEVDFDEDTEDIICCFPMLLKYRYLLNLFQVGSLQLIKSKYNLCLYA